MVERRPSQSHMSVASSMSLSARTVAPFITHEEFSSKVFNDPVHGHIELDDVCVQVIDTPQFQRLRDLKQTGAACFVFPGATHTRFEHSIGVCHLADEMISHIRKTQPDLGITDLEAKCVRLAGLCHDLGHGPFSHLFDNGIIRKMRPDSDWTHEKGSEDMLEYLVSQNKVDINAHELRFIKDLIHGSPRGNYPEARKLYLFDIVSNQRNSVDVDKRDCHHIGIKCSLDAGRLIKFSRVVGNEICYNQKEAMNLCELFHTRYSLFKRVYTHKVSTAIEFMILDAMAAADRFLGISESIDRMDKYIQLNDSILCAIEYSNSPELQTSREILARLRRRDLYRIADQIIVPFHVQKRITKSMISVDRILSYRPPCKPELHLVEHDIIIQWLPLSYTSLGSHPLECIRFYRKYDVTQSLEINRKQVSALIPEHCQELVLRVYSRDPKKAGVLQRAFRRLIDTINKELGSEQTLEAMEATIDYDPNSPLKTPLERSHSATSSRFATATAIPDLPHNLFFNSSTTEANGILQPNAGMFLPDNYESFDSPQKRRRCSDTLE
eukprot:jgi/Hompol1/4140/HPOL_003491-RA